MSKRFKKLSQISEDIAALCAEDDCCMFLSDAHRVIESHGLEVADAEKDLGNQITNGLALAQWLGY